MAETTVITNDNGKRFTVRTVHQGDGYGVGDAIIHDIDDPIIEFYDLDQDANTFGERGQFVSRYRASTVAHRGTDGINLESGVDGWYVDANALAPIVELAKTLHRSCTDAACI